MNKNLGRNTRIILFLLFLNITKLFSQQISFSKSYHIGYDSNTLSFIELVDSGYILVGYSKDQIASPQYSFAMRLNKYGDTLWTKKYLPNAGIILGITRIDNTTCMVSGGFGISGGLALTIATINLNGDTLWRGEYGYATSGWAGRIHKTQDNGYIMNNAVSFDYGLLKLDSTMNVEWHIWQNMNIGCIDILPDYNNGSVAVGGRYGIGPYEVARIDSSGTVIWQYQYGTDNSTMNNELFASDVVIMPDSNYLVGTIGNDWQLMKINRISGDTFWTKNYYDTVYNGYYQVLSMDYAGNDKYILGMGKYFMLVDADGDSIWKKEKPWYSFTSSDAHTTSDGGFAFCGQVFDPGFNYLPIGFVKLDSLGNTVFTSVFNPENNLQPLTFYPNPASNEINISPGSMAAEKNLLFTLCDLQGRTILHQLYNASTPIDVSTLPEGLYVATLKGKEKEVRGKLVIQR